MILGGFVGDCCLFHSENESTACDADAKKLYPIKEKTVCPVELWALDLLRIDYEEIATEKKISCSLFAILQLAVFFSLVFA